MQASTPTFLAIEQSLSRGGIFFRTISESDTEFLKNLYGTTREMELQQLTWSDEQKEQFISMQFDAQHKFYMEQFSDAEYWVISRSNKDIGRLYLRLLDQEVRIIDIALLPTYQQLGIGKILLKAIMQDAQERELPVTIHVEKNNPAKSLYKRLGFELIEDQGVYDLMQWSASNT